MFKTPNDYRIRSGLFKSDNSAGNNGAFSIKISVIEYFIIASDGEGWEHVSVTKKINGRVDMPNWNDMCTIKNMFWDEEDAVMQFHPPKSEYVNNANFVLHLWRECGKNPVLPPSILVGIKNG